MLQCVMNLQYHPYLLTTKKNLNFRASKLQDSLSCVGSIVPELRSPVFNSVVLRKMDSDVVSLPEFREFGHKCFSISSFLSFILIIVNTIVNVNNNLVSFDYLRSSNIHNYKYVIRSTNLSRTPMTTTIITIISKCFLRFKLFLE